MTRKKTDARMRNLELGLALGLESYADAHWDEIPFIDTVARTNEWRGIVVHYPDGREFHVRIEEKPW